MDEEKKEVINRAEVSARIRKIQVEEIVGLSHLILGLILNLFLLIFHTIDSQRFTFNKFKLVNLMLSLIIKCK